MFAEVMIIYVENTKVSKITKGLLWLLSLISRVAGQKINKEKSIIFVYTSNECLDTKIKSIISFITYQKIKQVEIYQKYTGLLWWKLPMLMKEIHEDLNKWRDIPCLWIRKVNTVKMSIFPTLIYKFRSKTQQEF